MSIACTGAARDQAGMVATLSRAVPVIRTECVNERRVRVLGCPSFDATPQCCADRDEQAVHISALLLDIGVMNTTCQPIKNEMLQIWHVGNFDPV